MNFENRDISANKGRSEQPAASGKHRIVSGGYHTPGRVTGTKQRNRRESFESSFRSFLLVILGAAAMFSSCIFVVKMFSPFWSHSIVRSVPAELVLATVVGISPMIVWLLGDRGGALARSIRSFATRWPLTLSVFLASIFGTVLLLSPWSIREVHAARDTLSGLPAYSATWGSGSSSAVINAYVHSLRVRVQQEERKASYELVLKKASLTPWSSRNRVIGHLGLANLAADDHQVERMSHHLQRAEAEASWYPMLGMKSIYRLVLQESGALYLSAASREVDDEELRRFLLDMAGAALDGWSHTYAAEPRQLIHGRHMKAIVHFLANRLDRAEAMLIQLVAELEQYDPHDEPAQAILGAVFNNLGLVQMQTTRYDAALASFNRSLAIAAGEQNRTLLNIAVCHILRKDWAKADVALQSIEHSASTPAEHALMAMGLSDPEHRLYHLSNALRRPLKSMCDVDEADLAMLTSAINNQFLGLTLDRSLWAASLDRAETASDRHEFPSHERGIQCVCDCHQQELVAPAESLAIDLESGEQGNVKGIDLNDAALTEMVGVELAK